MSESIEPKWLDNDLVLYLHDKIIAKTGGSSGIQKPNEFEAAMVRAPNSYFHGENENLSDLAEKYTEAIAENHVFADGNKRTAFVAANAFLMQNGYSLDPKFINQYMDM